MTPIPKKRNVVLRILLHASKLPILYLLLGLFFLALSYIDDVFHLTTWKTLFWFTDKLGAILIVMALLTFLYNLIMMTFWRYEKNLSDSQPVWLLILANIRKSLRIIFILITINIIIFLVSPDEFYLILADNIIKTIIIGFIGWIAIQVFYTLETIIYQKMIRLSREESIRIKALYTKMHILRNIATVVIVVITIAAILMSFGSVRNIGISLLASAGFLTAIVGLAAQKTLFSLFSGLQIALSQSIKIGDTVAIENVTGTIEEITFTFVTLKLVDKRRLILPINYFIEKPFQNWSHDGGSFKDYVYFYVDFMMPIDALRNELDNILKDSQNWDGVFKKLQIADLTNKGVLISVQVSARTADNLTDLRAEIREHFLVFIREHYPEYFPQAAFPE